MLAFLTNMVPFLSYLFKNFAFLKHFMKNYAIVEISTKNKIICNTGCGSELMKLIVLPIFRILRHNDVITILYWTYEFRFKIRVLNLVCVLIFNS